MKIDSLEVAEIRAWLPATGSWEITPPIDLP